MSDMAREAARVAVEPSGSERDTMELLGGSNIDGQNREVEVSGSTRVKAWEANEFQAATGTEAIAWAVQRHVDFTDCKTSLSHHG